MRSYIKILFIILVLCQPAKTYAQDMLGVIPYKIANPADNFTIETGSDYGKLISLGSCLSKDVNIIPHEKIHEAMKQLSLNSQRIITEDNLIKIGEMADAECILIGTLSRAKNKYISDSILYSMKYKKIISKSHASSSGLIRLAEEEMNQIFFNFPRRSRKYAERKVDATILIDLSYKISPEWESVKKGILEFAGVVSENWNTDTELNIIPFSDKYSVSNKYFGLKSFLSINEKLNALKPAGTNSNINFERALGYSLKNIPWRRNSEKIFIIISNFEGADGKSTEQHALAAKMNKIASYTISLGLLKRDASEPLRQFANISSGIYNAASYHQRFYNEKGDPVDVFFEGGRIFHTLLYDDSWKNGLFGDSKNRSSALEKPKSFLNEIFYDEKKYNLNPYNLSKYYSLISGSKVINAERLEDNIAAMLENIGEAAGGEIARSGKLKYKKPIAKALISDGKISMWIRIKEERDLDVVKKSETANSGFLLGVTVKKSPDDPYGITFNPDTYISEFPDDYIPGLIKTDLSSIIKNPDHFTSAGFMNPPVWFINIRVDKIESLRRDYDIRERGRK